MIAAWLLLAPPAVEPIVDDEDEATDGTLEAERRTVVVTGTRSARPLGETPVATSVVRRRDVVESGAENVAEALEETPGLQLTRGIGNVGVRLQGLDPSYTLVLVDGQRTTGRVNGVLDLSRFSAEDVEQIEIVRGAASVLYGADALAGTINIVTRRPTRPHAAEGHVSYGSRATLDASARVAIARKRWNSAATAGLHRTAGWDADPSDVATTGPRQQQWNVSTAHELHDFGPFSIRARAEYMRRDALRVDLADAGATFDRRNLTETVDATLSPRFAEGPAELVLTGHYALFRDQFVQDQRGSTAMDQYEETFDHLGQFGALYAHQLGKHRISAGVDAQIERLVSDRVEPGRVDRHRYALFVQDEWMPWRSPRVAFVPGARVDVDSMFGAYPTPRLAMMVAPLPWLTVRASYGRGFRSPSFRELYLRFANPSAGYIVRGNPELRPETSWSTQISVEAAPLPWLALVANVFDNRLRDTIVVDTDTGTDDDGTSLFQYVNVGEATTRGVESTAVIALHDVLRLEGSYTYVWTHDSQNDRPLPGRSPHAGTVGLRLARARWGTTLRTRCAVFGTRTFFVDDGMGGETPRESPPFATLDVRVSQDMLAGRIQLFAGVENALDAGDATDNPIPPRSFYGGLNLRY